jgi:hypothetical protein
MMGGDPMKALAVITGETRYAANALPNLDRGMRVQIACGAVLCFIVACALNFVDG